MKASFVNALLKVIEIKKINNMHFMFKLDIVSLQIFRQDSYASGQFCFVNSLLQNDICLHVSIGSKCDWSM